MRHWDTPLAPTPFHARTAPLNRLNRWGPWAGYATALCFGDEAMEHSAIRNAATLYDLCPMVKYEIEGPEAEAYLNRLTVRDVRKLTPGGVQYTVWCDDEGHVLDDGTLFRLTQDSFRLTCQERHLPWLLDSADGFDVAVTDATEALASLALQGPCTASVLRALGVAAVEGLKPFRWAMAGIAGTEVLLSRTGFTGDLGYELWFAPEAALPVWDALMAAGTPWGLRPVGSDALGLARLEAGFLIANVDFIPAEQALREDRARTPWELGLGWLVDLDKGPFTGRRALAAKRSTPRWVTLGLDVDGNIPAAGAVLYHRRKAEAGVVTAAAWSPTLKANIALAQVEARHARGEDLWAEIYALRELRYEKLMVRVRPAARPFFNPARRRATPPEGF
jgi:aminomethyltransferase